MKNFEQLIALAHKQVHPQRLLFVFARAEDQLKNGKYSSGQISPVICTDKSLKDLVSFESLVSEADEYSSDWNIVLISSFENRDGSEPTSEQADEKLKLFVSILTEGKSLNQFTIIDREQRVIYVS